MVTSRASPGPPPARFHLPRAGLVYFGFSGLVEGLAYLAMWRALAIGEVSVVSPLVNAHSIVAIVLAAIFRATSSA